MSSTSIYQLQTTSKSFCSKCLKPVDLLSTDDFKEPWFYICWQCQFIAELGEGEVNDLRKPAEYLKSEWKIVKKENK